MKWLGWFRCTDRNGPWSGCWNSEQIMVETWSSKESFICEIPCSSEKGPVARSGPRSHSETKMWLTSEELYRLVVLFHLCLDLIILSASNLSFKGELDEFKLRDYSGVVWLGWPFIDLTKVMYNKQIQWYEILLALCSRKVCCILRFRCTWCCSSPSPSVKLNCWCLIVSWTSH